MTRITSSCGWGDNLTTKPLITPNPPCLLGLPLFTSGVQNSADSIPLVPGPNRKTYMCLNNFWGHCTYIHSAYWKWFRNCWKCKNCNSFDPLCSEYILVNVFIRTNGANWVGTILSLLSSHLGFSQRLPCEAQPFWFFVCDMFAIFKLRAVYSTSEVLEFFLGTFSYRK